MTAVSNRPSVSALRWVARIFGTLIAFTALFGIGSWLSYLLSNKSELETHDYLVGAGFLLGFVGCVVGWFKDLAASLFILGGIALILVTALAFPGKLTQVYFFAIPALPGFLYLYVHLASKNK